MTIAFIALLIVMVVAFVFLGCYDHYQDCMPDREDSKPDAAIRAVATPVDERDASNPK